MDRRTYYNTEGRRWDGLCSRCGHDYFTCRGNGCTCFGCLAQRQAEVRLGLEFDEDADERIEDAIAAADVHLITASEAAKRLGVSEQRVRALLQQRQLGRKLGRDWRLTEADIAALTDRKPGRPPSKLAEARERCREAARKRQEGETK